MKVLPGGLNDHSSETVYVREAPGTNSFPKDGSNVCVFGLYQNNTIVVCRVTRKVAASGTLQAVEDANNDPILPRKNSGRRWCDPAPIIGARGTDTSKGIETSMQTR